MKYHNYTEEYIQRYSELEKEFHEFCEDNRHLGIMALAQAEKYGDRPQMYHKCYGQWEHYTWKEIGETINAVSKGLLEYGINEEDRIGIFSGNRPEWHMSDFGSLCIRCMTVPIYPTNTTEETEYIVNDAGIKILFVSRQDQYDRSYPLLKRCDALEKIIVFHKETKIDDDPDVIRWEDFLETGRQSKKDTELEKLHEKCHYEDRATLIYTSGTTGEPKGAIHTHRSLFHNSWGVGYFPQRGEWEGKSTLVMLPLSHVLERSWDYGVMQVGGVIVYCEDHTQILDHLKDMNPTLMCSAPRLFEKIYSTIHAGVGNASGLKKAIFNWSVKVGEKAGQKRLAGKSLSPLLAVKHTLADKFILGKVRGIFGKNFAHANAGGAPLSAEIHRFFYNCGVVICPGYGLTETAPVITINGPHCLKFGSVGPIIPLVQTRIDEVTGEIQAKGPNVIKEYFNKPKQTAEAFTDDGWFKTGDIGHFDEDGYLYITDRIKDLIITSGGKNIAPQLIETLITEDFFIEYAAIIGDGRNYITALIVPSFDALEEWARDNKISFSSREELVENPQVIEHYTKIIEARQESLGRVEKIKKFTLLPKEFSQDEGEITPTMKVKRKVIEKKYSGIIEKMYQ